MELMLFCILLLQGSTFTASVKITINPSIGDILLGESKAFICKVVDGEADDIIWYAPSEEEIEEGDNAGQRIAVSKEEYKSQLVITGATTADNGRYTCRASADSGADHEKSVNINVIQDPVLTTRPIQEFREGWNAVIPCEAVGIPAPSVSWRFQGREIAPSGRFKVDDRGLLIDNVRTSDAGIYTCVGRIEDRNVETTLPITVTVEFAPIFETRDPEVVLSWVGNPVNISCTVQSHPRSEVVWRRNGTNLGSVGIIQFTGNSNEIRSTLQIQADSLEDFSSYSCIATNILGLKTYIVELREGGIPGPPRNLTVVSRSTDISGSFNPPEHDGGIPVLSYRVEWRENSRSEWNVKRIGNEYFQLFGLQPHTRYALRVSAINGRGIGNHSNLVYVRTPSLWKTDVPNVSASRGETGSSIRINFQKPENEDIPVTRYIIHYREFGDVQWVRAVGNCSDSVLLNDLHSATLYELKVQAESPEGLSPTVFLNATTAHKDPAASVGSRGKVGTVSVVAIILGTFLVIVAGVDAVCYRTRRCGIFMCLVSTLGRQRQSRGRLEPETGGESTR